MTPATDLGGDVVLSIENLTYGTPQGRPLIEGVSFQLEKGHVGLITGPNGIGKSTLLKIILGAQKPLAGCVERAVDARHIAYLPQMQNKTFHVPILLQEVIDFARPRRKSAVFDEDLAQVSLLSPTRLRTPWNDASGGERQKALLSMTLLSPSPLILLDEPLNHLDQDGERLFAQALSYVTRVRQKSVLLVSHGGYLLDLLHDKVIQVPLDTLAARGTH
jgi:ABC-type Mn2+/Zn2+ transport system ATPase subunit